MKKQYEEQLKKMYGAEHVEVEILKDENGKEYLTGSIRGIKKFPNVNNEILTITTGDLPKLSKKKPCIFCMKPCFGNYCSSVCYDSHQVDENHCLDCGGCYDRDAFDRCKCG